jgi:hypothetical protein
VGACLTFQPELIKPQPVCGFFCAPSEFGNFIAGAKCTAKHRSKSTKVFAGRGFFVVICVVGPIGLSYNGHFRSVGSASLAFDKEE